ncbi:MAG: repeat protein [Phycisphaerales bacterium]|nr:repeat protein [Phycisphaerales bacterium]
MSRWTLFAPWLLGMISVIALAAAVDADELPPGAIACLGTRDLRHGHTVSALSFSGDGKLLASASWDQTARVWDVASGREVSRFSGHGDGASAVAISPDGLLVASGDMQRTTVLWDARTGKELHRLTDNPNTVFWLRFSGDGKRLVWSSGKLVRIWDVAAWREERSIDTGNNVRPVVLSPDEQTLAVGCEGGSIQIRRVADGTLVTTLQGHAKAVFALAFHPDGTRLLSGGADRTTRLWDLATSTEVRRVELSDHWVRPVAFVNGGRQFASAAQDGTVGVWETESGKDAGKLVATGREDAWVMAMASSPDGKILATAGTELAIRLWDAQSLKPLDALGHTRELSAAVFGNSDKTIITASQDGSMRVWDAQSGQALGRMGVSGRGNVHLGSARNGRRLVIRGEDATLRICDFERGSDVSTAKLRTLELLNSGPGVNGVTLSADGALAAATYGHASVRVIDTRTGNERFTVHIDPRQWAELPLAFSPDGRHLAVGSGDLDKKYVTLFDADTGREETQLPIPSAGDNSIAFSPDGATLAVACRGQPIRLVEVASRSVRGLLEGDGDAGTCLVFSPDGRMLAAGGGPDRPTVRVWDLGSGRQTRRLVGHTGWLTSVAFSFDSKRLVSASRDTTAIVWDVARSGDQTAKVHEVDAAAMAELWSGLADDDPAKAYQAIRQLSTGGDAAVGFLASKLISTAPVDDAGIERLIAGLDADEFTARETAGKALAELGDAAATALRKAMKETQSSEVRTRVEVLLTALQQGSVTGPRLREVRAVEVLQWVGTARAIEVLKRIADARTGSPIAASATDAAKRLSGGR